MSVGMFLQMPGGTREFYDAVLTELDWDAREKPRGFISHYAGSTEDGWLVFDVWESRDDFHRFLDERLAAAVQAASGGQAPSFEPQFVEIHREDHAAARV